jgi:hypothetical protein
MPDPWIPADGALLYVASLLRDLLRVGVVERPPLSASETDAIERVETLLQALAPVI